MKKLWICRIFLYRNRHYNMMFISQPLIAKLTLHSSMKRYSVCVQDGIIRRKYCDVVFSAVSLEHFHVLFYYFLHSTSSSKQKAC